MARGKKLSRKAPSTVVLAGGTALSLFLGHSEKDIESSELDMVVDTGAVMILLPQDEVEKLGLEPSKKLDELD